MLTVVTRTVPPCPACTSLKIFLKSKGVPFSEIEVLSVMTEIKDLGIKSVPAVFNGPIAKQNFIGGLEEVRKLVG
jgi:glutaredoxin